MKLYKIAVRNIFRNKRRSLLSASAIAVAGITIVFLFGLLEGMINDMEENIFTYLSGAVRIRNAEYDKYERLNPLYLSIPDYKSLLRKIETDPAVTSVSPRISFPGYIPAGETTGSGKIYVMGSGVDFNLEQDYQNYKKTLIKGRLPKQRTREAVIGKSLAEKTGTDIGDKITILSRSGTRGTNAYTFTVTGILSLPVPAIERTMVQIPLETAQKFLWMPNQIQEIFIKVDKKTASPEETAARLSELLISDVPLSIKNYKEINGMAEMIEIAVKIYDIIAVIFFLLGSTVIINTTIMVIYERTKEIGILGTLGMTGKQITQLFFMEAMFISAAGAFSGIICGIVITGYYSITGFNAMEKALNVTDSMGLSSVIYPVLNFKSTVMVFIYSIVVAGTVTWFSSRKAAKITPVDAIRGNY